MTWPEVEDYLQTNTGIIIPIGSTEQHVHGNVWEWCLDPWHDDYKGAPSDGCVWDKENQQQDLYSDIVKNIKQLLTDERSHGLRGGSYFLNPRGCRSAYRGSLARDLSIGFRVVCVPPRSS